MEKKEKYRCSECLTVFDGDALPSDLLLCPCGGRLEMEGEMQDIVMCPFCEERIPAVAAKCPYCAESLGEPLAVADEHEMQEEQSDVVSATESKNKPTIASELPRAQVEHSESELKRKLTKLQTLYTDGIITEEECKAKREKLINEYLEQ